MNKKLLVLGLLFVMVSAIYEHQAGKIDWKVKNFGQLQNVKILNEQILFLNSQNQFGSIHSQSGQVSDSERVDNKKIIWNKNQKGNILISDQSTLILNNLKTQSFQNYPELNLASEVVDFVEQDGIIHLITAKKLIQASTIKNEELFQVFNPLHSSKQRNERFLRVEHDAFNNLHVVSFEVELLCVLTSQESSRHQPKRNCHKLSNPEKFDSEKLLVTPKFIFYPEEKKQILFDLAAQQWQEENLGGKRYQVQEQDNLLLVENDAKIQILQFATKKLQQVAQIQHATSNLLILKHQEAEAVYFATQKDHQIDIFALKYQSSNEPEKIGSYYSESLNKIKQGWLRKKDKDAQVLIQRENLQTEFFSSSAKKLEWKSQQSIIDTLHVAFVDYPKLQGQKSSYYGFMQSHGIYNPIYLLPAIQKRLTEELVDLVQFFSSTLMRVLELASKLVQVRKLEELSQLNRGLSSDDDEILYGMRKKMIAVTKQKVLVCYDSKLGQVEWESEYLSEILGDGFEFEGLYKLGAEQRIFLVYHSNQETAIFEVSTTEGKVTLVQKFGEFGKSLTVIEVDREGRNYLVLVNDRFEHRVFPLENAKYFQEQTIVFYRIEAENRRITGFSNQFNPTKFEEIWNFQLSQNESIVKVDSPFNHYIQSAAPKVAVFDDVKIIYKHIDCLNLAVVTQKTSKQGVPILTLYVLNSKTGRVLFNSFQLHVEFMLPINLVYDENTIVVTYFNQIQSIFEAWVVELFSNKIETSFITMLEKYYLSNTVYNYYDYLDEDLSIVFLEQKYGLSMGVKSLDVVQSKLSLTKRNLVAITHDNQIYQIDRISLSTRRAITEKTEIKIDKKKLPFQSVELPPYSYLIPINPNNILSYYLELEGVNKIQFVSTELESTQIIVVYGGDLFVTKIAPDKSYDMLSEGFNYIQLVATVILMIGVVYVMRSFYLKSLVFKIFYR